MNRSIANCSSPKTSNGSVPSIRTFLRRERLSVRHRPQDRLHVFRKIQFATRLNRRQIARLGPAVADLDCRIRANDQQGSSLDAIGIVVGALTNARLVDDSIEECGIGRLMCLDERSQFRRSLPGCRGFGIRICAAPQRGRQPAARREWPGVIYLSVAIPRSSFARKASPAACHGHSMTVRSLCQERRFRNWPVSLPTCHHARLRGGLSARGPPAGSDQWISFQARAMPLFRNSSQQLAAHSKEHTRSQQQSRFES